MDYQVYRMLHLVGIFAIYMALGGLFLHALNGGTKDSNSQRKPVAILHGVAMFLVLLGGFGMLARIGQHPHQIWVLMKLGIWLLLGGLIAIPYRLPQLARPFWLALPLVGILAAWIAFEKPGYSEDAEAPAAEDVVVDASAILGR